MGAAAAAPLFLLNVDEGLSVVYNDSQAKLATKYDSRLRRYEIGFRSSFFSACAHEDVGANLRLHFYQLS
jgi:hypothetical protein